MRRAMDALLRAFDRETARRPEAPLAGAAGAMLPRAAVDRLAGAAGAALDAAPPAEGAVVGLVAPDGPGFLAALVALWRRGLVPLLLDAGAPPPETRRLARGIGASALLRQGTVLSTVPSWEREELGAERPAALPGIAAVKLTSGTAGEPKGIAVTAEALLADAEAIVAAMGLAREDRLLAAVPMSHSYGFSLLVLPPLLGAGSVVVPGPEDPLAAAARAGATVLPTVPAWLRALARLPEPPRLPDSLRLVIAAGEPLAPETARACRERLGRAPRVFYGASECGGICWDPDGGAAERGTVGAPLPGVSVALGAGADADLVVVRSPAVGERYVPRAEGRLAEGRFETDDCGSWSGGELRLHGRRGECINVHGRKVHPSEVEDVLATLPGVDEVAVVGLSLAAGEGETVRAVVACAPGSLGAPQVLRWCRERLSPHKIPRSIVLVRALPRNARGKVDRAALRTADPR
jgi:long-chain acyl-CoA synthetase